MLEEIKTAIGHAWDLLFSAGTKTDEVMTGQGVVIRFMGFLQKHPIFLVPLGLYLIVLGIKTTRKLITGL